MHKNTFNFRITINSNVNDNDDDDEYGVLSKTTDSFFIGFVKLFDVKTPFVFICRHSVPKNYDNFAQNAQLYL